LFEAQILYVFCSLAFTYYVHLIVTYPTSLCTDVNKSKITLVMGKKWLNNCVSQYNILMIL